MQTAPYLTSQGVAPNEQIDLSSKPTNPLDNQVGGNPLMHFLSLRLHDHAQIEARIYAEAICALLKGALPEAMDLFDKYKRH